MRELKFRVWDYDDNKWHYFDVNGGYKQFDRYSNSLNCLDEVWYQSTGIEDINGDVIYEHDDVICSKKYNGAIIEHKGFVKFEQGSFIVACETMTDKYMTFIELSDWDILIKPKDLNTTK